MRKNFLNGEDEVLHIGRVAHGKKALLLSWSTSTENLFTRVKLFEHLANFWGRVVNSFNRGQQTVRLQ